MISSLKIILGLITLIWSAEKLVTYSAKLAAQLGIRPVVIGLTIIGFGTSAPEIFVSILSSLSGTEEIALGNALGSNIANIGFVVGPTAILFPILKPSKAIKSEMLSLLGISFLIYGLLSLYGFTLWLGITQILLLFIFILWLIRDSQKHPEIVEIPDIDVKGANLWVLGAYILVCLVLLSFGAHLLVDGAAKVATAFGIREAFIGLTIVAIGTSLPELAVSISGVLKKQESLALGNIIGSNIFNLTAVLAPICLISPPQQVSNLIKYQDFPIMLGFTLVFTAAFYVRPKRVVAIGRKGGTALLILYICYLTLLINQAANVV